MGLSGHIYYDGSADNNGHTELDRAAWAVVEVDDEGNLLAHASGPVWRGIPQTNQGVEHCAFACAAQLLEGPVVLHGDCKGVVKGRTHLTM